MTYTVQQLATLADVSVRTLHHYDAEGLLKPTRTAGNGYRQYDEQDLLKLQQILFFRELDFSLPDIKKIVTSPNFDITAALHDHRALIEAKKKRLTALLKTIDKTISKINNQKNMEDKELYENFTKEEMEALASEAKDRWGNTTAYKQSQERYGKLSAEDKARLTKEADELMKAIASHVGEDPASEPVQKLMAQHYAALSNFYDPNIQIYRGLAEMFIADPRFTAYYEKYAIGLAQFMHDAMLVFCDNNKN